MDHLSNYSIVDQIMLRIKEIYPNMGVEIFVDRDWRGESSYGTITVVVGSPYEGVTMELADSLFRRISPYLDPSTRLHLVPWKNYWEKWGT